MEIQPYNHTIVVVTSSQVFGYLLVDDAKLEPIS